MKRASLFGLLLGLAASLLPGQTAPAALPAQPLGPDDLLGMTVANLPEMSRQFRVGPDGLLRLPFLSAPVPVRSKWPQEVEEEIRGALRQQRILVDPVVSLSVVEYSSRPVTVIGAVRRPTTFQATAQTTVLDALARAEGFAGEAGSVVLVTRTKRGANEAETVRIPVKSLLELPDPAVNFRLYGGEQVRVPDAPRVYVLGNVKRPAAVAVKDPAEATVMKILSQAEGLGQYAASEAVIYRPVEDGRKEIVIDLRGILKGKAPDVRLEPYDVLYIPESRGRRLTAEVVSGMVGFGISTASGLLVFKR